MATISHVGANSVASSAHQNGLIDQVNTNTTDIASGASRITTLETKPKIVLRKNADQTIRNQTDSDGAGADVVLYDQTVTWQVVEAGTASMKVGDTVVVPSGQSGIYFIAANVNLMPVGDAAMPGGPGTVGGEAVIYITKNGEAVTSDAIAAFGQPGAVTGGLGNGLSVSITRNLVAGDVLRVMVFQSSDRDRPARATAFGGCTFAVSKL